MPYRAALVVLLAAGCSGPKLSPEVILDSGLPLRPPLTDTGIASTGDEIRGLVSLKLRDRDVLDAEIAELYKPESATFRKYMSVDQFMALHGPLEEDVSVVSQWFVDAGLTVARVAKNRMLLQITGTVAEFNAAFAVELHKFVKSDDDDYFQYGTDEDLLMIRDVGERVSGFLVLDPAADDAMLPTETGTISTDPPPDVENMTVAREAGAYGLAPLYSGGFNGTGSTIGVVAGATFRFKDLQSFWQGQGITRDDPERVVTMEPPSTRFIETTIDIEWSGGMAPGAKVIAYEAHDAHDTSVVYAFNAAIGDGRADVITDSFAHREDAQPRVIRLFYNDSARMAAALGITVVAAGGDSAEPDVPSACPYVTAVGGTTLLLDTGTGAVVSERAWVLSGSGDSIIFGAPPWQIGMPQLVGTMRAVVDVALNAGTAHWSYVFGEWGAFGGTSFSTPVFAGLIAVINGKRRSEGKPVVGFLNQTLYTDPAVQATFRDITTGGTSFHQAGEGWDYPTGWGAPDAAALADALR